MDYALAKTLLEFSEFKQHREAKCDQILPIVIATCEEFLFKIHSYEQNVGWPPPDMLEAKTTQL